jgi:hypothetical protein
MRKLLFASVLVLSVAAPLAARADVILEGSLGKGYMVKPELDNRLQPTSVMVAPGLTFFSVLRLQLGVEAALPDVEQSKFDLGFRPMLTVSPPILPLYGRLILAFNNLLHDNRTTAYGGALGFAVNLPVVVASVGVFAEIGLLPRSVNDQMQWNAEARAGVAFKF